MVKHLPSKSEDPFGSPAPLQMKVGVIAFIFYPGVETDTDDPKGSLEGHPS